MQSSSALEPVEAQSKSPKYADIRVQRTVPNQERQLKLCVDTFYLDTVRASIIANITNIPQGGIGNLNYTDLNPPYTNRKRALCQP